MLPFSRPFVMQLLICLMLVIFVSAEEAVHNKQSFGDDIVDEMAKKVAYMLKKNMQLSKLPDENFQKDVLTKLEPEIKSLQSHLNNSKPWEVIRLQKRFTDEVLTMSGLQESDLSPRFPLIALGLGAIAAAAGAALGIAAVIFG